MGVFISSAKMIPVKVPVWALERASCGKNNREQDPMIA
jgi:hypothetical protein